MADVKTLYDDVILDHIKNARNYHKIENASVKAEEFNPLCGDVINLYMVLDKEIISDIGFQCSCCGISMASTSIMTEKVLGRRRVEAQALAKQFIDMVERYKSEGEVKMENDALAVLATVREFPSRISCATLAWKALEKMLAT